MKNSLYIKYTIEFFVVVLGISVSFWLSEWNDDRKSALSHIDENMAVIDDLEQDRVKLEYIDGLIKEGCINSNRVISNIELFRSGTSDYLCFADSLIEIGFVYSYATFFMNDATYKSLIAKGRMHEYPSYFEKHIKGYYEYVAKRSNDNNRIMDDVAIDYYHHYHPFSQKASKGDKGLSNADEKRFFAADDIRAHYSSLDFYKASLAFQMKIIDHGRQISVYLTKREQLDSLLRGHAGLPAK